MLTISQNILIILLTAYMAWDNDTGNQIKGNWPAIIGMLVGLTTGNLSVGLVIGDTLQLTSLGVAATGGSPIPEYGIATIVGVFIAIRTGVSIGIVIAVGLPVGMLTLQSDVVIKIINNFFAHWSQRLLHEKKLNKMDGVFYLAIFVWMLKYITPIALVVMFGMSIAKLVLHVIPAWITNGLAIAGGMLPVVGIGMLLRYMSVKKYLAYLLAGFVSAGYLKVPIPGIAILGLVATYEIHRIDSAKEDKEELQTAGTVRDEGDDSDE